MIGNKMWFTWSRWLWLLGLSPLFLLLLGCRASVDEYPIPPSRDGRAYSLSSDTVYLDTLPTEMLSSTYSLRLFNPTAIPLELAHVRLKYGGERGFQINVDGRAGGADGLRIEARDSIFIFVRAFFAEGESDLPTPITDSIVVAESDGRQSYIPVLAVRQNVRHIKDFIVRTAERLEDARPIVLVDSIYIAEGGSLRLAPGTRLLMSAEAHIRVEGELIAEGTQEGRISLGSIRRDQFLPRVPYLRVPGQWGGVVVGKRGRLVASYMQLSNAKWGIYFEEGDDVQGQERLRLGHCRLHNISGLGILAGRGRYTIEDSELSNTLGATLSLSGGEYFLRRSSVINYYPWPGIRSSAALVYTDTPRGGGAAVPTSRLLLEHCVVDGSQGVGASGSTGGEVDLRFVSPDGAPATVQLIECYLRSREYSSPRVDSQRVIYAERQHEAEKLYGRIGLDSLGRKDYLFDYRPLPSAPFVGLLRGASSPLPPDLWGVERQLPAAYGASEPIK